MTGQSAPRSSAMRPNGHPTPHLGQTASAWARTDRESRVAGSAWASFGWRRAPGREAVARGRVATSRRNPGLRRTRILRGQGLVCQSAEGGQHPSDNKLPHDNRLDHSVARLPCLDGQRRAILARVHAAARTAAGSGGRLGSGGWIGRPRGAGWLNDAGSGGRTRTDGCSTRSGSRRAVTVGRRSWAGRSYVGRGGLPRRAGAFLRMRRTATHIATRMEGLPAADVRRALAAPPGDGPA